MLRPTSSAEPQCPHSRTACAALLLREDGPPSKPGLPCSHVHPGCGRYKLSKEVLLEPVMSGHDSPTWPLSMIIASAFAIACWPLSTPPYLLRQHCLHLNLSEESFFCLLNLFAPGCCIDFALAFLTTIKAGPSAGTTTQAVCQKGVESRMDTSHRASTAGKAAASPEQPCHLIIIL